MTDCGHVQLLESGAVIAWVIQLAISSALLYVRQLISGHLSLYGFLPFASNVILDVLSNSAIEHVSEDAVGLQQAYRHTPSGKRVC